MYEREKLDNDAAIIYGVFSIIMADDIFQIWWNHHDRQCVYMRLHLMLKKKFYKSELFIYWMH